ncbi:MAG: helix-turn-helix domain-containing protein [Lentisphaeria bacterium]|nr:helix-turn-helix domain-containing protein [Lentisphaeria bacterium]
MTIPQTSSNEPNQSGKSQHADSILRSCKQSTVRRHLVNAKRAMEILGISRPTLRAYVNDGYLTQIKLSQRKIRFDEDELLHFANVGMPAS